MIVSDGTYSRTYTITVNRHATGTLGIEAQPEDAIIHLTNSYNERILPGEDGRYAVTYGYDYTCTVTAPGYVGQKMSFTATGDMDDLTFALTEAEENTTIDTDIEAQWPNFRNGDNHLGLTDAKTPTTAEDTELLWAAKYGIGWSAAPGSPILVDDCLITYVSKTIKKLDVNTGAVVAENDMVAASSFAIVPPTYADGMIFVGLSGGRIQAFNADTLESLWVYTDPLGGQPNCPITYSDGYIYAGFWNNEDKDANFACIQVADEDPTQTTEEKLATWTYTRKGGFYWAGAYASDKYVVVGTDDGQSGNTSETASLLVLNKKDGTVADSWDGIRGDIRSNVSYDPESDRVFFSSKGGVLCNASINWETGEIKDTNTTVIVNAGGLEYAMSTCTPSVYNGRIYIGTAGDGNFTGKGFCIAVYELQEDGSMTQAYTYAMPGYDLALTGLDAEDAEITDVQFAEGNGIPENIAPHGTVSLSLPEGMDYRNYIFLVQVHTVQQTSSGTSVERDLEFTFMLRLESGIDLDLQLNWQPDGQATCTANGSVRRTVKSDELDEGVFSYELAFLGDSADDAEIVSAEYRTTDGEQGELSQSGILQLAAADGQEQEIYYLSVTARVALGRQTYSDPITYTFAITYEDGLDL